METQIQVENLVKIFSPKPEAALALLRRGHSKEEIREKTGATLGVRNVSFTVNRGEIFVLMGLSGSGKSTLIRCLNRLIEPTSGRVIVDGEPITEYDAKELRAFRRKKIGMVFQHFALFPHRTVLQNVVYGLEVQGIPKREREEKAMEALSLVGLDGWHDSYPHQLSGGMQQRVGLARSLAVNPDILLMDEAFSALDPLIRREMQDELLNLQEKARKTIVFVTHDLSEALKIGDRIAIMKDGEIVQIDTPEGILTQPADEYVASFTQDIDRSRVLTAGSVMMRNPETIDSSKAGPRVALRKMRELGLSSVFVVDHNRRLQGIIMADDAVVAVKRNETSLAAVMTHDFPRTTPDTPLSELIPVAVGARTPIAVVDEKERLLGIVVRVSVLAGLAGEQPEQVVADRNADRAQRAQLLEEGSG